MKNLRTIRIFLATIFFVATLALLIFGATVHPMAPVAKYVQVIPSALSATAGAALFWFVATFLFGRIYCSTVSPIGSMQDCAIWLRRKIGKRGEFRYKNPGKTRYHILIVYVALLVLLPGAAVAGLLLDPWHIMENIISLVNRDAVSGTWGELAFGTIGGMIAGGVSLILLSGFAYHRGRDFCTRICPLGSAMGASDGKTLLHIEINPDKCTVCGKCEDVCPAKCIKVVSRYVDNSRCVRCFDCLYECPEDAINYQVNKNLRFNTPLFRRRRKA